MALDKFVVFRKLRQGFHSGMGHAHYPGSAF
jgi:hypothetical protein